MPARWNGLRPGPHACNDHVCLAVYALLAREERGRNTRRVIGGQTTMLGRQSSLARPNPVGAGAWDALKPAQASTYETVAIMKGNEKNEKTKEKSGRGGWDENRAEA